jgi:citrate synthase
MTQVPWQSNITTVERDRLVTRGVDQRDIIRDFSYEEMVFLLLRGRRPSPTEATLLRAVIVAHVSHGITGQSTIAVRAAADCRSGCLHALLGGFSVGAGVYHQGGLEATMEELERLSGMSRAEVAQHVEERLAKKERIMGFGHRFHAADPRAATLVDLAAELEGVGPHLDLAIFLEDLLRERRGIRMNIEAAGGAILLDLGFPSSIGHLFIVVGRSPMLAAAYLERLEEAHAPFQRIAVSDLIEDTARGA